MNTHRKALARSGVRIPVASLALSALIAAAFSACTSDAASTAGAPPPPEVSVAQVLTKNVRQWDDFSGRVAAVETVELRPRVSGYVDRVVYNEGDEVKKGDLLFSIDPRPYRATLARAQAQLESARSEARLASAQGERAKSLIEAKAISREEFETRSAANAQGTAGVRAAEAAVASAQLDLQFTQVRSPIDGRAGRALITAGNLAQADATLLTTVVSIDPVHVYFDSDEQSLLRYEALARSGDRAASDNAVRVGLANDTGYPHAGTVDFTDNQVDATTGTIRARAVLPNPDRALTPGMFARVQLEGGKEARALLIDDKAVVTDQDRKFVYVIDAKGVAQRKDVVLGRMADGLRVVQSGLAPTDRVIVNGVQKVFAPGMPVKATTVAMGAAEAAPKVAQR